MDALLFIVPVIALLLEMPLEKAVVKLKTRCMKVFIKDRILPQGSPGRSRTVVCVGSEAEAEESPKVEEETEPPKAEEEPPNAEEETEPNAEEEAEPIEQVD